MATRHMTMDLRSFGGAMGLKGREIEKWAAESRTHLAVSVFKRLTGWPPVGTPRDTRRASFGWDLTVGRPSKRVQKEGKYSGWKKPPPGFAKGVGLKTPLFLANNVPYIGILNRGHSQQSPSRFVERAIRGEIRRVEGLGG